MPRAPRFTTLAGAIWTALVVAASPAAAGDLLVFGPTTEGQTTDQVREVLAKYAPDAGSSDVMPLRAIPFPHDRIVWFLGGDTDASCGHGQEAVDVEQTLSTTWPVLTDAARVSLGEGDAAVRDDGPGPEAALHMLNEAIAALPCAQKILTPRTLGRLYLLRGVVAFSREGAANAREDFRAAASLEPELAWTRELPASAESEFEAARDAVLNQLRGGILGYLPGEGIVSVHVDGRPMENRGGRGYSNVMPGPHLVQYQFNDGRVASRLTRVGPQEMSFLVTFEGAMRSVLQATRAAPTLPVATRLLGELAETWSAERVFVVDTASPAVYRYLPREMSFIELGEHSGAAVASIEPPPDDQPPPPPPESEPPPPPIEAHVPAPPVSAGLTFDVITPQTTRAAADKLNRDFKSISWHLAYDITVRSKNEEHVFVFKDHDFWVRFDKGRELKVKGEDKAVKDLGDLWRVDRKGGAVNHVEMWFDGLKIAIEVNGRRLKPIRVRRRDPDAPSRWHIDLSEDDMQLDNLSVEPWSGEL